jgi:hypothetical protein
MTHVIHRIRIELGASDRGTAMMAQNEVSRAIHDNLSAELTPVLDGRFPPDIQKRIDRLELDLGRPALETFSRSISPCLDQ